MRVLHAQPRDGSNAPSGGLFAAHASNMWMKHGPKSPLSPSVGEPCLLCGIEFCPGDYTTLLSTEPTDSYCDEQVEVHWHCRQSLRPFRCVEMKRV